MKQKSFFDSSSKSEKQYFSSRKTHGGVVRGKRKLKRVLVEGKWTHLVLKSDHAKGAMSFLSPKNKIYIAQLVKQKSKKFGVVVHDFVNMGNHIHFKIKFSKREQFQKFLISITGLIARFVTKARKGTKFGKFWNGLAFTRVLTTAIELLQLRGYFEANQRQRELGQSHRELYLDHFNRWVQNLKLKKRIA